MKTIFTINVHSVVDVITNSSSVLFVNMGDSKEIVSEMIKNIYPNYLNEYDNIRSIDELSDSDLEAYVYRKYGSWINCKTINGLSFDEMYERYECGNFIKDGFIENNKEKIINSIDPERKMFFLFSLDGNPDFEMQEELENIMTRYHLG